jgi:hypothetical protein
VFVEWSCVLDTLLSPRAAARKEILEGDGIDTAGADSLHIIESSLFVVCLDHVSPTTLRCGVCNRQRLQRPWAWRGAFLFCLFFVQELCQAGSVHVVCYMWCCFFYGVLLVVLFSAPLDLSELSCTILHGSSDVVSGMQGTSSLLCVCVCVRVCACVCVCVGVLVQRCALVRC